MTLRTHSGTVTFVRPFTLSGISGQQSPGTYTVETDEERIEGSPPPTYRRVSTMIRLAGRPGTGEQVQVVVVDPDELAAALARDADPPDDACAQGAPAESRQEGTPQGALQGSETRSGETDGRQGAFRPTDRLYEVWRFWAKRHPMGLAGIIAILGGVLFAALVLSW
ncbi:hypothetical protein [Inquilinus sp. Marseille-Q2685]|uniref:hypothetical protein n=1 Tax=Inquilinus sp. Marseille-Q2685 TaxID=2866581 RepID=UPI001CE4724D|nr:hypothetical protein [Inquilinus sp. Marseille-Q2685]